MHFPFEMYYFSILLFSYIALRGLDISPLPNHKIYLVY